MQELEKRKQNGPEEKSKLESTYRAQRERRASDLVRLALSSR